MRTGVPIYRNKDMRAGDYSQKTSRGRSDSTFREKRATLGSIWEGVLVEASYPPGAKILDLGGEGTEFLPIQTEAGDRELVPLDGKYSMKVMPTHGVAWRNSAVFEDRVMERSGPTCTAIVKGKLVRADAEGISAVLAVASLTVEISRR